MGNDSQSAGIQTLASLLTEADRIEFWRQYERWIFNASDADMAQLESALKSFETTEVQGLVLRINAALKDEAGPDLICLGGANLAQSLHAADLIDAYRLMLTPSTMGGGKRLFADGPGRDFELVETLTTDVGSLILTYSRKR